MFAFALMSASLVHVLMRYYRSPGILIAGMALVFALLASLMGTSVGPLR